MKRANLSGMSVEGLMDLRRQVERALVERKAVLEKQLKELSGFSGGQKATAASGLKGRKVAAKYRGPSGETWSGRGLKPRWVVASIKGGKKLDDFLIDNKSARNGRKKRRSKR
jgi:DNA-binding protein H-NS